jgi:hypothetical protein
MLLSLYPRYLCSTDCVLVYSKYIHHQKIYTNVQYSPYRDYVSIYNILEPMLVPLSKINHNYLFNFRDSLSAVCPSIMWFYFFAVRKHFYYLPCAWCRTYHYMTEVIPHIFSGTSFYITILYCLSSRTRCHLFTGFC